MSTSRTMPGGIANRATLPKGIAAFAQSADARQAAYFELKRSRGAHRQRPLSHWGPTRRDGLRIARKSLWDADHILPVAEGGGECECDLENLRTLCLVCHRRETRALRRKLAQMA